MCLRFCTCFRFGRSARSDSSLERRGSIPIRSDSMALTIEGQFSFGQLGFLLLFAHKLRSVDFPPNARS